LSNIIRPPGDAGTTPEVPSIVVGYRRLGQLKQTLTAVLEHHRGPVYVFLDAPNPTGGPRAIEECEAVLEWVSRQQDQHERMKVLRPERNLGVVRAMPAAIDWVLGDGHDNFVLLEEDCLPSPDFYPFMRAMLHRFEDDHRVAMVSGNQFLPSHLAAKSNSSYYFSRYAHIWGWGAWRRSWSTYDHSMSALNDPAVRENLRSLFARRREQYFYESVWDRQLASPSDSAWASRWLLAMLLHRGLCICPRSNLVTNLGFGSGSTHTARASRYHAIPHAPLTWPLRHPLHVVEWLAADRWWFDHLISKAPLSRIRRYLPSIRRNG